jgi:tRNA threonylcarbamoyladenosine biosynthesis protein TsaE
LFETADALETETVGAELAAELQAGDLVFIAGELGAGKTTFVRGACRALGVDGAVTSPTFAVGHRYPAGAALLVAHLDLYRLSSLDDESPELLDAYVGEGRITFVEWPEIAGRALGTPRMRIEVRHAGADRRTIEVRG